MIGVGGEQSTLFDHRRAREQAGTWQAGVTVSRSEQLEVAVCASIQPPCPGCHSGWQSHSQRPTLSQSSRCVAICVRVGGPS